MAAAGILLSPAQKEHGMDLPESHTHSFIIKIWREQVVEGENHFTWRGHITRVPGGERRYLKDLDDIALFILPSIEAMGVRVAPPENGEGWLRQWKVRQTGQD